MQTRYPEAGAYSCAGDLYRALMAAAADCEPAPDHIHPAAALHWTPPEIVAPEWRQAGPGEAPEFFELKTGATWLDGRWVKRLEHTPENARPVLAFHGPGRPHLAAPRVTFAFQPGPGARASFTVAGTHARLQAMAETVRKGWSLYGGGPKPAELTRQAGPRKLATWPAAALKAWRIQLQEPDHVGAMLTGAQLGAVYFPAAGSARAVALAAPVQVAGLPDDLCSALRDDGRWVVSCMLTGKAIGRTGYGSRATAEREALAEWARVGAEKAAGIVARARADGLADPAAGRAAWCQAHGIEDPAAPEGLAMATETAADPAPVAPADGLAHAEAAHLAAACLQRFGVLDLAACEHLASFAAWRLETLRAYRAGCVDAARAAWRESHAEPVGARLRAALAALREITPPDAAALAAAPAAPAAPAAAPRGAGPLPPPVAPIEDTPASTTRGGGQARAGAILAARPMAIYCTAPRIIGVHEWACVVYISELYGPCTDYVWRRVSSARAGGPFEGGRFFPGREWPTYDSNRGNHGQPQTLARLYAGNREAIAAALDDGRAGRLPDWAGPAHAAALQSWREWEQRRAAMLRAPIVARPPAPARPIEPDPVAPAGGAPHDTPTSAPIEGPPDSTSLEAAAAPDLATMRAAGEMAERLATMARAAAGPDLKRQARMLRSEAARIRAPRPGIAPAIRKRWAIAASMLEYGAQVLADQAAAPGAVRAAAPAAGPGFKPAAWRSCTAPAGRGGQVRARRAWHAARHPVATGPPCTAAPRVAPV